MDLQALLDRRHAVKKFDPAAGVGEDDLQRLLEKVVLTPSSFNLQNWHFLIIRDPKVKAELQPIAYGQEQIVDAPALVLVLGRTDLQERASLFTHYPEPYRQFIHQFYEDEAFRREEAVRSASLAAMTFMLAAAEAGYDTCPMIGFDKQGLSQYLKLPPHQLPVVLIPIGKSAATEPKARVRFPLEQVVSFV